MPLEFPYNASTNPATGHSPFYLPYGQQPYTPVALLHPQAGVSPAADEFLETMATTMQTANESLHAAQQ